MVKESGVSLVELMIVITVVGLTLVLGGESFVAMASRQKDKTVTTELAAELRAARHLASTRRERVRVVFRPGMSSLHIELADSPGMILRRCDFHDRGVVVESLSNGPSIIFHPSGRAATPTTITLRNAQQQRWQMTVSITGRVSIF